MIPHIINQTAAAFYWYNKQPTPRTTYSLYQYYQSSGNVKITAARSLSFFMYTQEVCSFIIVNARNGSLSGKRRSCVLFFYTAKVISNNMVNGEGYFWIYILKCVWGKVYVFYYKKKKNSGHPLCKMKRHHF